MPKTFALFLACLVASCAALSEPAPRKRFAVEDLDPRRFDKLVVRPHETSAWVAKLTW
jgi:hypothetical protein